MHVKTQKAERRPNGFDATSQQIFPPFYIVNNTKERTNVLFSKCVGQRETTTVTYVYYYSCAINIDMRNFYLFQYNKKKKATITSMPNETIYYQIWINKRIQIFINKNMRKHSSITATFCISLECDHSLAKLNQTGLYNGFNLVSSQSEQRRYYVHSACTSEHKTQ